MSPWMMALIGNTSVLKTQTFTANATWVAPAGVTNLPTLVGKGRAGNPETDDTSWYDEHVTTVAQGKDNNLYTTYDHWTYNISGTAPANYSEPIVFTPDDPTYSSHQTYHEYVQHGDPGSPATTGASTTGFGKTFPGGTGGPASLTNFANVPVTPLASYSIVVPVGGSLTISYYQ